MKTVAIAGASGVVGTRALEHLLARDDVGGVIAVGRRELPVRHGKLASKVADLQDPAALARALPAGLAAAVCCLGTTMRKAGSKAAFRAVDLDAVVAFGRAARERGAARFVLVSSIGAGTRAPGFYLRTKGEAEEALARLGYPALVVLRPSFIDDQGARADHRPGERVGLVVARAIFAVLGRTRRYAPISADAIARALVRLTLDAEVAGVRTVESDELHAVAAGRTS